MTIHIFPLELSFMISYNMFDSYHNEYFCLIMPFLINIAFH